MQRLKFRLWNKKLKEMWSNETDAVYITLNGEVVDSGICDPNKAGEILSDDFVIMQWTGQKDSEGKDIYEKDVLKIEYKDHSYAYATVEFEEENGEFDWFFDRQPLYEQLDDDKYTSRIIGNTFTIKIIKDVLKETKTTKENSSSSKKDVAGMKIILEKPGKQK